MHTITAFRWYFAQMSHDVNTIYNFSFNIYYFKNYILEISSFCQNSWSMASKDAMRGMHGIVGWEWFLFMTNMTISISETLSVPDLQYSIFARLCHFYIRAYMICMASSAYVYRYGDLINEYEFLFQEWQVLQYTMTYSELRIELVLLPNRKRFPYSICNRFSISTGGTHSYGILSRPSWDLHNVLHVETNNVP